MEENDHQIDNQQRKIELLHSMLDLELDIEHEMETIKLDYLKRKKTVTEANLQAQLAVIEKRITLKNIKKELITIGYEILTTTHY